MSGKYERVLAFDIMKGLGILLVILGHSSLSICDENSFGMFLNNAIYSFHMPMFFIINGYFYKEKDLNVSLVNDFHRLLVPYVLTSILCVFAFISAKSTTLDYSYVPRFSIPFLIGYAPVLWFLVALFISKNLFNFAVIYIERERQFWLCTFVLIVSLFGFMFQHLMTLDLLGETIVPFSIAQALSALLYLYVGRYWHQHGFSTILLCLFIICFVLSVLLGSMSMFSGRYPYLIINVAGAIGGTYLLYKLSELLAAHIPFMCRFLSWTGRVSLLILCVHCLDFVFGCRVRISNEMIQVISMLFSPLFFSYLLTKFRSVQRIFRI